MPTVEYILFYFIFIFLMVKKNLQQNLVDASATQSTRKKNGLRYKIMALQYTVEYIPHPLNRISTQQSQDSQIRDRPRFFDQVGHQTTNAPFGNKHFSLYNDLIRLTKIMNNLVKDLKILSLKVSFQCLKLVKSFPKKKSVKNI